MLTSHPAAVHCLNLTRGRVLLRHLLGQLGFPDSPLLLEHLVQICLQLVILPRLRGWRPFSLRQQRLLVRDPCLRGDPLGALGAMLRAGAAIARRYTEAAGDAVEDVGRSIRDRLDDLPTPRLRVPNPFR